MNEYRFKVEDTRDAESGLLVRRLTDGHSMGMHCHLLYFNMRYYTPDGKTLFFGINKDGKRSFCRMDIEPVDGFVTARTLIEGDDIHVLCSSVSPDARFLFYATENGKTLYRISTEGGEPAALHTVEEGWKYALLDVASDGKKLVLSVVPETKIEKDLGGTYGTFEERFEKVKESSVIEVDAESGETRELVHPEFMVSHVTYRPGHPETLIFCKEGPWARVGNRLHLVLENGEFKKVRVQGPKEVVGHEFWLKDGSALGYHGRIYVGEMGKDPRLDTFGLWYPDEDKYRDWVLHAKLTHTQAHTSGSWFFTDSLGGKLCIYKIETPEDSESAIMTPLAQHDGTWHQAQEYQPHPTCNPDGRSILYNSNRRDMTCDIYQVFVED